MASGSHTHPSHTHSRREGQCARATSEYRMLNCGQEEQETTSVVVEEEEEEEVEAFTRPPAGHKAYFFFSQELREEEEEDARSKRREHVTNKAVRCWQQKAMWQVWECSYGSAQEQVRCRLLLLTCFPGC